MILPADFLVPSGTTMRTYIAGPVVQTTAGNLPSKLDTFQVLESVNIILNCSAKTCNLDVFPTHSLVECLDTIIIT